MADQQDFQAGYYYDPHQQPPPPPPGAVYCQQGYQYYPYQLDYYNNPQNMYYVQDPNYYHQAQYAQETMPQYNSRGSTNRGNHGRGSKPRGQYKYRGGRGQTGEASWEQQQQYYHYDYYGGTDHAQYSGPDNNYPLPSQRQTHWQGRGKSNVDSNKQGNEINIQSKHMEGSKNTDQSNKPDKPKEAASLVDKESMPDTFGRRYERDQGSRKGRGSNRAGYRGGTRKRESVIRSKQQDDESQRGLLVYFEYIFKKFPSVKP